MSPSRREPKIRNIPIVLLVVALFATSTLAAVPVTLAATPALDCGGVACVATVGSASGGSSHPITMSGSLSTSSSPDLIVVIVTGDVTGDTPATPTLSGVTFSSVCTLTNSAPIIAIYAGKAASTLSSATVSETESGNAGSATGGMVAFGISNYDTTDASPFDGTCTPVAGSGTTPSQTVSSLSDGNDFIFAGVTTSGGTLSATGATTLIVANTGTVYTAAGYQNGGGGGSYTLAFSAASGSWSEGVVAVKSSTPTAVPLFPSGVLPILVTLPLLYYLAARWRKSEPVLGESP